MTVVTAVSTKTACCASGNRRRNPTMAASQPCGLSQEVTLAVLPRLHLEELVLELGRRNIRTDGRTEHKNSLVSRLQAVMGREYRGAVAMATTETQGNDSTRHTQDKSDQDTERREYQGAVAMATPETQATNSTQPTLDTSDQDIVSGVLESECKEHSKILPAVTSTGADYRSEEDMKTQGNDSTRHKSDQDIVSGVLESECRKRCNVLPAVMSTGADYSSEEDDPFSPTDDTTDNGCSNVATTDKQQSLVSADVRSDFSPSGWSVVSERSTVQHKDVEHTDWIDVFKADVESKKAGYQKEMDLFSTETVSEGTRKTPTDVTEHSQTSVQGLGVASADIESKKARWKKSTDPFPTESVSGETPNRNTDGAEQPQTPVNSETQRRTSANVTPLTREKEVKVTFQMKTLSKATLRLYKCPHCTFVTSTKATLQSHVSTKHEHGRKCFKCDAVDCDYFTPSKKLMVIHRRKHTGEKPYRCTQCSYAAASSSTLIKHQAYHTAEKRFKCNQCDYSAIAKNSLVCHMGTKHGVHRLICEKCGYRTALQSNFNRHLATHNRPVGSFKCPHCDYASTTRKVLKDHILSTHTSKLFACDQCDYKTTERRYLKCHLENHGKEKPHKCTICDFAASNQSGLKVHQAEEHEGKPVFSCSQCSYKACQRYILNRHIASVHN